MFANDVLAELLPKTEVGAGIDWFFGGESAPALPDFAINNLLLLEY